MTFQSKFDLSSDEKDSVSKDSAGSDSSNRASLEKRANSTGVPKRLLVRDLTSASPALTRIGAQRIQEIQMKPKDISDRTQGAFEDYLFQVNSMYFRFGLFQPTEGLNEITLKLSGVQNGALGAQNGQCMSPNRAGRPSEANKLTPGAVPSTLDMLWNPLRANHIFEDWSPREIATFESCMCRFGKKFGLFTKFIRSKTTQEIIDFYYWWKSTSHFKIWEQHMEASMSDDRN